jgi:hypothetical protein
MSAPLPRRVRDSVPPEGKSMAELRRIVADETARFDRIGAVWSELTDDEQRELVHRAEAMHAREAKP